MSDPKLMWRHGGTDVAEPREPDNGARPAASSPAIYAEARSVGGTKRERAMRGSWSATLERRGEAFWSTAARFGGGELRSSTKKMIPWSSGDAGWLSGFAASRRC